METSKVLQKNIYSTFFKYVSLNVLSMFGLSLYVLADTFFVSNGVGSDGLIALNLALPAFSLINGIGLLMGIGGATVFAIALGRGEKHKLNRIFTQTFIIAAAIGILLTLIGLLFSEKIAVLLGATGSIIPLTQTYVMMILIFACAFILNNLMIAFVRNDGNPKLSMFSMLAACLFNIVFDYIFIFPLQMGMFGAALATGVAPILSMLILSSHFIKKHNSFKFEKCKVRGSEIRQTLFTGMPSFISEFSSGIVIFIFNTVILTIAGGIGVAAYGIIANIALVCVAIFTGIGQGIQPVASVNFGAGNMKNVRKTFSLACGVALLCGLLFYFIGQFFPQNIAMLFNSSANPQLTQYTVEGIRVYFTAFILMGINIVITSFFAAISKPKPSFIISLSRGLAAVLPFVLILPAYYGLFGVWVSVPIAELLTFAFSVTYSILFFRKQKEAALHISTAS
ncbi:MAG: MATE family efflux transporter [Christensenellaceae bacterium]